jgi:hypothetical protein
MKSASSQYEISSECISITVRLFRANPLLNGPEFHGLKFASTEAWVGIQSVFPQEKLTKKGFLCN